MSNTRMEVAGHVCEFKKRIEAYVPDISLLCYFDEKTQKQLLQNWRVAVTNTIDQSFTKVLQNQITMDEFLSIFENMKSSLNML